MRVIEVVQQRKRPAKLKKRNAGRTDFEKNATKLRSRDRKLDLQRPVPPIKHSS